MDQHPPRLLFYSSRPESTQRGRRATPRARRALGGGDGSCVWLCAAVVARCWAGLGPGWMDRPSTPPPPFQFQRALRHPTTLNLHIDSWSIESSTVLIYLVRLLRSQERLGLVGVAWKGSGHRVGHRGPGAERSRRGVSGDRLGKHELFQRRVR